jgi:hypothetical protein
MNRSALDRLVSWIGLALAAVLLVAGGLLAFASSFVSGQVANQLSAQKITMPVPAAYQNLPKTDQDALAPFQGQPLTTGAQAEAFADHYIQAHMNAAGGGKTYEEVSGEYIQLSKDAGADPAKVKDLGDLRQTLFMGNTLRSMLLTAYAFGTMGTVAGIASVVSFIGAAALVALAFLGLRHAKSADAVPATNA